MKAKKVLSGALAAILLTLTPGVAVCAEEMAGQEQTAIITNLLNTFIKYFFGIQRNR